MGKVPAIKHSDKNRLERIWGLKTLCFTKIKYLYKITDADLFLLLQGYSKATKVDLFPTRRRQFSRKMPPWLAGKWDVKPGGLQPLHAKAGLPNLPPQRCSRRPCSILPRHRARLYSLHSPTKPEAVPLTTPST